MAEQLREVVGGQTDAPFRQIEAKFVAHRPAQPGIEPRRRRPDAFDEAAQDDAVGFRQARFELAEDVELCVGKLGAPHHAIGKGGLEKLGIVGERRHQADALAAADQFIESGGQCEACRSLEGHGDLLVVGREIDQDFAVAVCEFGKVMARR